MLRVLLTSIACFLVISIAAQSNGWVSMQQNGGVNTPTAISTDSLGNVYVSGTFRSQGWKGGPKGSIVSKYCSLGQLVWSDTIASAIDLKASAGPEGNIYITGHFKNTIRIGNKRAKSEGYCSFIAMYDTSGNCSWIKPLPRIAPEDIIARKEGGFYIAGKAWNDSVAHFDDHSITGKAFFIAQYNSSGRCQWVKNAAFAYYSDNRISLAVDEHDNVYAAGHGSPARGAKGFAAAYDKSGNALWITALPTIPQDIAVDNKGNTLLAGEASGTVYFDTIPDTICDGCRSSFIIKLDNKGAKEWSKIIEGERIVLTGITSNTEGELYVTGSFYGNAMPGGQNITTDDNDRAVGSQMIVARLGTTGDIRWIRHSKVAGTGMAPSDFRGHAICINSSTQQLCIAGEASDTTVFEEMVIEGSRYSSLVIMGIKDIITAEASVIKKDEAIASEIKKPAYNYPVSLTGSALLPSMLSRSYLQLRRELTGNTDHWKYLPQSADQHTGER